MNNKCNNRTSKALIIVDYQKEWMDKSSQYFVGDISSAIAETNQLIEYCRKKGYKIIFTKHIEPDSEKAFSEQSDNTNIIDDIKKQDSDTLITKYRISPFFNTTLDKELKGVEEIVVAGILTNLCVRSTVQDAYDRDFDITVIKDCCVAFDEETQNFTFKDLKATREEIEFLNAGEFIN